MYTYRIYCTKVNGIDGIAIDVNENGIWYRMDCIDTKGASDMAYFTVLTDALSENGTFEVVDPIYDEIESFETTLC